MAYTKIVDYAAKDALITGNPAKLIKGTEIGAEFDAIATATTTMDANLTAHTGAAAGAHAATAISNTPAGAIAATTVQAAINELDTEKAPLASPTFTGSVNLPDDASVASLAGSASVVAIPANKIYMHAFPTGTKMAFFQATAPLGWTQDVANNDAVLRVVSTAGAGTGGTGSIATGVVMPTITDSHILTTAEIPAHTHTVVAATSGAGYQPNLGSGWTAPTTVTSSSVGGGGGHTHTITAANWVPKYIDVIICTKD